MPGYLTGSAAGGGGAPTGAAGGDLAGSYPNPSVPGVREITANTQAASYTLALTDAGKSVEMNLGTATVLTVPANATVAFPVGSVIEIVRLGAGAVTLTPAAGVVLRNRLEAAGTTSRTITSQYSTVSFRKRAVDEWVLVGDLT